MKVRLVIIMMLSTAYMSYGQIKLWSSRASDDTTKKGVFYTDFVTSTFMPVSKFDNNTVKLDGVSANVGYYFMENFSTYLEVDYSTLMYTGNKTYESLFSGGLGFGYTFWQGEFGAYRALEMRLKSGLGSVMDSNDIDFYYYDITLRSYIMDRFFIDLGFNNKVFDVDYLQSISLGIGFRL